MARTIPACVPARRRLACVLHAFVLVDAEPARIAALAEELAATDGVTEAYSVAGGVADLIAVVRVAHHDDLAEVVTKRIDTLPGVESTTTLVAFQAFSRHDLEAVWDIGPA
jgi:DNA-binding Lrp family transcriptional regulator